MFPVFSAFVDEIMAGQLPEEVASLRSMFRILAGLKAYQAGALRNPAELQAEVVKHHRLFLRTYGIYAYPQLLRCTRARDGAATCASNGTPCGSVRTKHLWVR